MASRTRTASRARGDIRGSGTGTRASRRSSGGGFEPARARAELESLLAAQRPDGFIGHTIFWAQKVSLIRSLFYNVTSRSAFQTETIQPPLLAWAWRIAVGDPAAEPRIGAHMDWLAANRDLEGDGLLWILQPDESGLDASPKFEPVWGRRAERPTRLPAAGPAQPQARLRRTAGPRRRPPRPLRTAGQHDVVALAAGAGPTLGDAGAGRAALGRAPRTLHRRGPAGWSAARRRSPGPRWHRWPCPDLPEDDRPPPGRGAPAERARVPHPGRPALGRGLGAELRARRRPRPDSPLLARPDLGQLGLDGLARPAPARLRGGGPAPGRRRDRRGRPRRPARVLRPAHRQGPWREGLRLVSAGCRAGRNPDEGSHGAAICSGR